MTGKRHHAVIAGTGRAGTSFLVRFLDACGLETAANDAPWFSRARAGLEYRLDPDQSLPYVVKDPWLFTYCAQLDLSEFQIDALILPMRELMSAAESRVHQERVASYEREPGEGSETQVIANTPGGVLYSLDVVDQARILGVGFYNLLHWAVANELPIFLPSFPRMVEDADYLLRVLGPWLDSHCTPEVAQKAFADTAAAGEIRIRPHSLETRHAMLLGRGEPDPGVLRDAALVERVRELMSEKEVLSDQISVLASAVSQAKNREAGRHEAEALLEHRAVEASEERDELDGIVHAQREELQRYEAEVADVVARLEQAERHLENIHGSAAWRLRQWLVRHRRLYRLANRFVRFWSTN